MEFVKMRAFINFCFLLALVVAQTFIAAAQTAAPSPAKTAEPVAFVPASKGEGKDERYRIGYQDQL